MSLEGLTFGLNDPLQANVVVKPYDAFALFVDTNVLAGETDEMKKATITQTLNEYQQLVGYYRNNGALTSFYLADTREPSTTAALKTMGYGPGDFEGWSIMWIRQGGRLEDTRLTFSGGISAAGIDSMLRLNPNHDPAIDIILPFSSINGNDIPVQVPTNKRFTVEADGSINSAPASPTFFTVTSETAAEATSTPVTANPEVKVPWFIVGLAGLAAWALFFRNTAPIRQIRGTI